MWHRNKKCINSKKKKKESEIDSKYQQTPGFETNVNSIPECEINNDIDEIMAGGRGLSWTYFIHLNRTQPEHPEK